MSNPVITVSSITYNHKPYIRQYFEGVLSQKTNYPFELVIHDDCSTDGTTEIIKEYARKYPDIIVPLYEETNQYQQGKPIGSEYWILPIARGRYTAFCEGDDYWIDPDKLQRQADFLESNPDVGLVYGRVKNYNQQTNQFTGEFGGPNVKFEDLFFHSTIPTASVMVRTDLFRKYCEDINPGTKKWAIGDYAMWLWFALNSKIAFQPEVTAVYRVLPESASHSRSLAKRYQFRLRSNPVSEFFIERYADRFTPEFIHRARSSRHELTLPLALRMADWATVDKIRDYYTKAEREGHVTPARMARMLAHPHLWRRLLSLHVAAAELKSKLLK